MENEAFEPKNTSSHKVLDILLLFGDQKQYISIEEMSQLLDIPKSTVYRHVRVLCEKGFLEKTTGANYRLGLTFLELGRNALKSNRDIRLIALPSMKRIAEQIGESVSLMRLFNRQAVCIESIEGQYALRVTIEQGRTQMLHTGASSKILLASLPEGEWEDYLDFPLKQFTPSTFTDFEKLCEELRRIRDEGYAISDGEIDWGARAIAIPLRNGRNEVIAALSIEAPRTRMDDEAIVQYLELLREESSRIHHELS